MYYAIPSSQIGQTPSQKALGDQTFAIRMDDAVYGIGTLGLQKDSEFLQIFNHYILKAIESGVLRDSITITSWHFTPKKILR